MFNHISSIIYHLSAYDWAHVLSHICVTIYHQSYIVIIYNSCPTPRADTLFNRSVRAEVEKHPELLTITMAEADEDPPPRLFPKRLKGYFKCPVLCRADVLSALAWSGKRGEYWSNWKSTNGVDYDGSLVFAHGLTCRFLSKMEPATSVNFRDPGYISSTSEILKKIRKFVPCLLYACIHTCHDLPCCMHVRAQNDMGLSCPFGA